MSEKVGIVVPTIGQRPEYLPLALKSIREAGNAYILLVDIAARHAIAGS
jgi:hypothetical protein